MDLRRVLGDALYERAKRYAEQKFGNRKTVVLIRIAVEKYLKAVEA